MLHELKWMDICFPQNINNQPQKNQEQRNSVPNIEQVCLAMHCYELGIVGRGIRQTCTSLNFTMPLPNDISCLDYRVFSLDKVLYFYEDSAKKHYHSILNSIDLNCIICLINEIVNYIIKASFIFFMVV